MGYPHNLIAERVNFTRPAGSHGTIQSNRCDGLTLSAGTSHLQRDILDDYGWRVDCPWFGAVYPQVDANELNAPQR
jgi:hypothetical protein